MSRDSEIGAFLRAQRARVRPEQVGLPSDGPHRRVPGLRREEVARLAGVSTDYYARLEQGRNIVPSAEVLTAIARALCMDEVARAHLFALVHPDPGADRRRGQAAQRVRSQVQRLLDGWSDQPAFLIGRRTDVLATNALGRALLTDFDSLPMRERNYTRWIFLDPAARELYVDWPGVASEMVAVLRVDAGRYPDDPRTAELVGELTMKSEEFRRWWGDHRVTAHTHGTKRFDHPVVGSLELGYEGLVIPGDADQTVYVYSAEPGTPSADALHLLAGWTAAHGPAAKDRTAGAQRTT
ncbi:helix-turn-helix transcriptional regulator [Streptomyces sp. NPDC026672]|uniref:helix-turn-helix transcriptional regulator n=1 Tax=unclassified Streptomyces TaxID=2593676 RepID=UPI003406C145